MDGLFLSLEGPDGSGKSTQARLLFEFLKKRALPVILTREPGGSPLAERLRQVLLASSSEGLSKQAELLLFEACRHQHVNDTILPALKAGKLVLCDRYIDSTLAYQAFGRGFARAEVEWLNHFASQGLMPERTLLFDLPEAEGLRRAKQAKGRHADRMEGAGLAFHRKVRRGYLSLQRQFPKRILLFKVSGKRPEQVHEEVLERLGPYLKKKGYAF